MRQICFRTMAASWPQHIILKVAAKAGAGTGALGTELVQTLVQTGGVRRQCLSAVGWKSRRLFVNPPSPVRIRAASLEPAVGRLAGLFCFLEYDD